MPRSGSYKFTSKKQSKKGIMSMVMAIMSLISFIAANVISFRLKGQIGPRIGAAGLIAALFSVTGLILGIMSLNENDVFRLFPWLGFILSVITIVLWGGIIMLGSI